VANNGSTAGGSRAAAGRRAAIARPLTVEGRARTLARPSHPTHKPQGVNFQPLPRGQIWAAVDKRVVPCADDHACDAAEVLSTVAVVEGKPQRPHRRLVALNARMLGLRCFAVDSVVEQIPGWSRHWSNVSDV